MYTVYVNETPINLITREEAKQLDRTDFKNLVVEYSQKRFLLRYIDNLEKGNTQYDSINVVATDLDSLKETFFGLFDVQVAAGGIVFNENKELLAIFRRGHWDLPKGKQDEGEDIETTAIREVEEECGIRPALLHHLIDTFHTYFEAGKWILKRTYWYAKEYKGIEELAPQIEEGITKVEWIPAKQWNVVLENTYGSIQDVLDQSS